MINRLIAVISVLVCMTSGLYGQTKPADPSVEPGLTARIGSMALLKLPDTAKTALSPQYLSIIERLQLLPVLPSENPEAQLKLIYAQVKDNIVSPELMVSAARAVNAILLPSSNEVDTWTNFRLAVVLRSQYSDLDIKTIPSIADISVFTQDLKKEGEQLKTEAISVSQTQDGVKMTDMRRKIATAATRATLSVWLGMIAQAKPLPVEAPEATKVAEKPDAAAPTEDIQPEEVEANAAPAAPPPVVNTQQQPGPQRPNDSTLCWQQEQHEVSSS